MIPILLSFLALPSQETKTLLQSLDLRHMRQGWGEPRGGTSVDGAPIRIGGKQFLSGVGSHSESFLQIDLGKKGKLFHAYVGLDDECDDDQKGTVEFKILLDGKTVWQSGVMGWKDPAKLCEVPLAGASRLGLLITDGGDGIDYDHGDWAEASITMNSGTPKVVQIPIEAPYLWTPKPGPRAKLTGPGIFGVRPRKVVFHTITATGSEPIVYSATGLPAGVHLDSSSGILSGTAPMSNKTYVVHVAAKNSFGKSERDFKFVVGDKIALTPPMGWNHWNCWGIDVDQEKVLSSARAMATHLKKHGWSYMNIDDGWQGLRGGKYNAIMNNKKFPDMNGLSQQIHAMGLRLGIYSTPWKRSYGSHIGGSSDHEDGSYDTAGMNENNKWTRGGERNEFGKYSFIDRDVQQWSDWGVDYLKYDWHVWKPEEVEAMRVELAKSNRDIVYSLSNSAPFELAKEWANRSNCWRTTGDITDNWGSLYGIWQTQNRWAPYAGPGHWNDPDMLIVGKLGWGPNLHATRLTPSEQYSHISLWSLLSAPLLLGCDLAQLDAFTLNLLTNDEILAIDQDSLGRQAQRLKKEDTYEVWVKVLDDGTHAIGIFNTGEVEQDINVKWAEIGLDGPFRVRDLWQQKSLGIKPTQITLKVPRHGCMVIKVSKS